MSRKKIWWLPEEEQDEIYVIESDCNDDEKQFSASELETLLVPQKVWWSPEVELKEICLIESDRNDDETQASASLISTARSVGLSKELQLLSTSHSRARRKLRGIYKTCGRRCNTETKGLRKGIEKPNKFVGSTLLGKPFSSPTIKALSKLHAIEALSTSVGRLYEAKR